MPFIAHNNNNNNNNNKNHDGKTKLLLQDNFLFFNAFQGYFLLFYWAIKNKITIKPLSIKLFLFTYKVTLATILL